MVVLCQENWDIRVVNENGEIRWEKCKLERDYKK